MIYLTAIIYGLFFLVNNFEKIQSKQVESSDVGIAVKYDNVEEELSELEQNARYFNTILSNRRRLSSLIANNETYQSSLLSLHNYYRSTTAQGLTPNQPIATNMNSFTWDDALSSIAQAYAEECKWTHNVNRNTDLFTYENEASFYFDSQSADVGENLYFSTGTEGYNVVINSVKLWYEEYPYYTFGNRSCQSGKQCGHYTALIWDDTRYVGCGSAYCDSVEGLTYKGTIVVCNYYPGGNYARQPYDNGTQTCSNCESDRTTCEDDLCSGCMSPYWNMCKDTHGDCYNLIDDCPASNCTVLSDDEYCKKCRYTCGACTDDMLQSSCNVTHVDDGDGGDNNGDGNDDDDDAITTTTTATDFEDHTTDFGDDHHRPSNANIIKSNINLLLVILFLVIYH